MRAWSDLGADLGEVQAHRLGADMRQGECGAGAAGGADGAEQPGRNVTVVAGCGWSAAAPGPDVGQGALLADPGFILEPDFYRCSADCGGERLGRQRGEVFLNVAWAAASFWG